VRLFCFVIFIKDGGGYEISDIYLFHYLAVRVLAQQDYKKVTGRFEQNFKKLFRPNLKVI